MVLQKIISKISIPRIEHTCCGILYDSESAETNQYFRAFWHKNINKNIDADFCLTIWYMCKNNQCVHVFTFFYNKFGRLLASKQYKGIKTITKLSEVFLFAATIKPKKQKSFDVSKRYLWKYAKSNNGKIQNIYTFDNIKVSQNSSTLNLYYDEGIDAS